MSSTYKLEHNFVGRAAALVLLAAGITTLPASFERTVNGAWTAKLNCALADGGSGRGDGGGHGGESSGSDGGSGRDGGGGHGGESGGSDGGNDRDGGGSSDSGSGHGGSEDGASGHGNNGGGHSASDDDGGSPDHQSGPRATVDLSDDDLQKIMSGERALIDDRGRLLELEIEIEDGRRTVMVKPHGGDAQLSPGPVQNAKVVDVAGARSRAVVVGHGGRALEVEVEHGVLVMTPLRSAGPEVARSVGRQSAGITLGQSSDDLSSSEEAALIQGGWR